MNNAELEAEIARLQDLLVKARGAIQLLKDHICAMQQQESAMAALFRKAEPALEGRLAHARVTSIQPEPEKKEKNEEVQPDYHADPGPGAGDRTGK